MIDRKNSKILSDSESADEDIPKKIIKKSKLKAVSNSDEDDDIPKKNSKSKSKSKKSQSSSKVHKRFYMS